MPHRFVSLIALAALSMTGIAALRNARRKQLEAVSAAKPAPLQTWEGEGGGLPTTDKPPRARRTARTT